MALNVNSVREGWGWTCVERLGKDAAYGLRLLRKSPGFSAVAILSLSLSIGAKAAIFGLIDATAAQIAADGQEFGRWQLRSQLTLLLVGSAGTNQVLAYDYSKGARL